MHESPEKPSFEQLRELLTAPGMPFEIEEVSIGAHKIKAWKNTWPTMAAIVEASRAFGDKEYIVYEGSRLSYEAHYRQVARLANHLVDHYGVRKGDRVAIAMRNLPEWSVAFWAAVCAGAIVVPMNAWWTTKELQYGLSDCGAKVAIVDQQRLHRLESIVSELPLEHLLATGYEGEPEGADDLSSLLSKGKHDALPAVELVPEDDATMFYTSGTTGFPKGTLGSHRNFCSSQFIIQYLGVQSLMRNGSSTEELLKLAESRQVSLLSVPLFHVTGCHGLMTSMFSTGGKVVMMYKWDAATAADLVEREKITSIGGVPAIVRQLVDFPGIDQRDLSSLISLGTGGAPATPELFRRMQRKLPNAGASTGYGITETSSAITMISGSDYAKKPNSVGAPSAVCDVKVVDAQGSEAPVGELGEFWVRGPNVVKGYWNRPEATAEAFVDGWYRTGDVGRVDEDGMLYIVDRIKDMIIRGGENVYCAEVEAALCEHEVVRVACVFGLPDEVLGEQVGAVVEVVPDSALTEDSLREYSAQSLSAFKVPVKIWLREEPLPMGATGKVEKKELRETYVSLLGDDVK